MDINEIRRANARALASREKFRSHFAEKIGKSTAQVNNWIGRNPTKNIGSNNARHIEQCYGMPHGWLDQYHAENADDERMLQVMDGLDADYVERSALDMVAQRKQPREFVEIPELDTRVMAKYPDTDALPSRSDKTHSFRSDWITREVTGSRQDLMAMRMQGDAMTPYLMNGDTLLFDTSRCTPRSGAIYVIIHDGEVRVSRVYRRGKQIVLHADNESNPAYRYDIELTAEESNALRILGEVVWRGG